jgi:predicted DNA-binding transcriptional regulator AlpA
MENLRIVSNERLIKASDVAHILNISRALAYRLMQEGSIPVVRINHAVRVRPVDLEQYIDRSRQEYLNFKSID